MLAVDRLLAFTVAAFLLIVIPGPSVLFVISRALAYGRRAALTTVLGGAAGSLLLASTVAFGVGAIVQTSAVVYTVVKYVGAIYLVYLGIRAFRDRRKLRDVFEEQATTASDRRTWWQGFVVAITNPKSALFFVAILPQFVDRTAGHPSLQMIELGAIFTVIVLISDSVWGIAAAKVRGWFARSERRLELVGGAAGLTMVGLGFGVAASGRKD